MKALKTIVATAVVVFTLTTVAMAGVQHLDHRGDAATAGQPQAVQVASQPATQSGVTLSAHQFAAMLRAVDGGHRGGRKTRTHDATHDRAHVRHQSRAGEAGGDGDGSPTGAVHQTAVHHTAAHHTAAHHTAIQTASHDGGSHDGGSHDGGGHDGGCD